MTDKERKFKAAMLAKLNEALASPQSRSPSLLAMYRNSALRLSMQLAQCAS